MFKTPQSNLPKTIGSGTSDSQKPSIFGPNFPYQNASKDQNPFKSQSKTPQRKGLFDNMKSAPSVFPNSGISGQSKSLFFPQKHAEEQQVQNQVNTILNLQKDNEIQKCTIEQMLKRIKELEDRNVQLQKQSNQLMQKNIQLQNNLRAYQQQPLQYQPVITSTGYQQIGLGQVGYNQGPLFQQSQVQQPSFLTQTKKLMEKTKPISFDYSKKDQLFTQIYQPTIFNEDEIYPNAFTEKTFMTPQGYAFQAYIAFNAFYAVKYIILQKIKNKFGYINLTGSQTNKLLAQTKEERSKNWYLYHKNSTRNILDEKTVNQVGAQVIKQMKESKNEPISINIKLSLYIFFGENICIVYHPDWTISAAFELELYNYYNFNSFNPDIKLQLKQNIEQWINEKNKEHTEKKSKNQLVMWFEDKTGSLHLIWN